MSKIIRLQPSGKEVKVEDGDTVLSALERHGYFIPNNCRAGACGECKTKVCGGEYDQGFIMDMALSKEDREKGFGLMCMAKPTSDVVEIEWETENNLSKLFPPQENMSHIVTEKHLVTGNIVKLRLRSMTKPVRFWPGQYITLGNENAGIPPRPYSIANIPNSDGEIILYVTKMKGGTTSVWVHDELKLGDRVAINGPYGTFIGDSTADTPVLCLASGSGLAPITSLASAALLRGGFRNKATVLFSARSKEDLFEQGLFSFLDAKFRNFKYNYTLTREDNPGGLTGRIPDILADQYPDLSNYSLYIAGSPKFVDACVAKVKELGAKDELIHTEGFHAQNEIH